MAEPKYVLGEQDVEELRLIVQAFKSKDLSKNKTPFSDQEHQGPEVYVARTPPEGIPAITTNASDEDVPGEADCEVYEIAEIEEGSFTLQPVNETSFTIYNISTAAIAGDTWISVLRDKFGHWIAQVGGGSSLVKLLLTGKTYSSLGPFIGYSWLKVTFDSSVGAYVSTGITGGPGNTPLYHLRNFDHPVVPLLGDSTGTGTVDEYLMDDWAIVSAWQDGGDYYLFDAEIHSDLVRLTGVTDSGGLVGYIYYWNQYTASWNDGREVRIITPS